MRETLTGKTLFEFRDHVGQISGLDFHRSKNWLATSDISWDSNQLGGTNVWDCDKGILIVKLQETGSAFDVCFSPDGTQLATAGADGVVRIFETESWKLKRTILRHKKAVQRIAFHPDGSRLATAGRDGRLCVFDVSDGRLIFEQDDLTDVRCVGFTGDGAKLACSTFSSHFLVWNVEDWKLVSKTFSASGRIVNMRPYPDGVSLLLSSHNGPTEVQDITTGEVTYSIPSQYPGISHADSSPNGDLIVACGFDAKVSLWSVVSERGSDRISAHLNYISDVIAVPGTHLIATGARKNTSRVGLGDGDYAIRLIDSTNKQVVRLLNGHTDWVTELDASWDGNWLASASLDGTCRVWDVKTGACLQEYRGHQGPVECIAFVSPTHIVSAGKDGSLKLWNASTGTFERDIMKCSKPISSLVAANLGGWIAASTDSGEVTVSNINSKAETLKCSGITGMANSLCFSEGGQQLAAAGQGNEIVIWQMPNWILTSDTSEREIDPHVVLRVPDREIRDMLFLPERERIAVVASNYGVGSSVRILDTVTGDEALQLDPLDETASSIAFDSQRRVLIVAANEHLFLYDPSLPGASDRWLVHSQGIHPWHVKQSDLAQQRQRPASEIFHLTQRMLQEPNNAGLYYRRANAYASQSRWEDARADFERYYDLNERSAASKTAIALVALAQDDISGFHAILDQQVEELSQSKDASVANTIAWSIALTPHRLKDVPLAAERVQYAIDHASNDTQKHMSYNTQALVLYRQADQEAALKAVLKSIEMKNGEGFEMDWILLALIHHALGNQNESREWYDRAATSFANATYLGKSTAKQYSRTWVDRFQNRLLLEEASRLIKPPSPTIP